MLQGCRFVPHFRKLSAADGTKPNLNIGFQVLALIQGQIYDPVLPYFSSGLVQPPTSIYNPYK